ncbi:MAG: beta-ketoacyl-ACP synthase III [Chitinophagales bacterium]|nr:ketoacyl-ACP synthase III [Bacteroidota bacterium]MCB9042361.1 ketoacyl-ACP synthase III [Chitinophagales bacterium]
MKNSPIKAAITGVAGYLPDYILSNVELEKMVDTNDEWIKSRTGISERRILKGEGLGTSDLATPAVQKLLEKTNTAPTEIDLLICATVTPDHLFPATSNIICDKLGITNIMSFDISAACSGFIFALQTARMYVEAGYYKKVVVVGADKMSSIVDYTDRSTCILFGDAAGAVLIEPSSNEFGIIDVITRTDGSGREFLVQKSGGSVSPSTEKTVANKEHYIYQEGKNVFKFAVTRMADVSAEILEKNNVSSDEIAWLVPHQANIRIIEATAKRMELSMDKVMLNIQKYGNTTAATIPLCLWEWENQLKKGDKLVLTAFGGGFTWGAILLDWAY